MLAALGEDVAPLRHVFPQDIKDPDLLAALKNGPFDVFVSSERAMRTRPTEAYLLKSAHVTALFFGPFWSKLTFWQQAAWLVQRWPTIAGFASGVTKGTTATVKHNGKSEIFQL